MFSISGGYSRQELIGSPDIPVAALAGETYSSLFERYSLSEIGQFHTRQETRYSGDFAYDETQMRIDLGDDVDPVEHGRYTHDEILVPLLHIQVLEKGLHLSDQDIVAIRIATHVHDFGESKHPEIDNAGIETIGDVPYHEKTSVHEKKEASVRTYIREKMYSEVPEAVWCEVEQIVAGKAETPGVQALRLVEHLGYYTTGLRAGYLALLEHRHRGEGEARRDDHSFAQLTKLGKQVTVDHREKNIPPLLEGFPYGASFLEQTTQLYATIHDELPDTA